MSDKTTATDELRRMLDERGVEWEASDKLPWEETTWHVGGFDYVAMDATNGTALNILCNGQGVTPAQVIATLGRETCKPVDGYDDDGEEIGTCCSECGSQWPVYCVVHYCPVCGAKVVDDASVD